VDAPTQIAAIFVLVLVNGLFAGAEIAILSMRKTRLQELAERGSRNARAVLRLRALPERLLATIQVGITVIGATAAAFGGSTLEEPIAAWLTSRGVREHADDLALAIVVVGISYLTLVLGELVPKSLALRVGERYALLAGLPLVALSFLARPLVWFLAGSSNLVLKLFRDQTSFTEARVSPQEIQQLMDEAAQAGTLHPEAGEIAARAVDLGTIKVSAVMVPQVDMVSIDIAADPAEIRRIVLRSRHRRFPVFEGHVDNVIGYAMLVEILETLERGETSIRGVVRDARFVPEVARAIDVLREMQSNRFGMALVVREQGTIAGLVTVEDLVEEAVGEIFSEHEPKVERISPHPDGSIVVDGSVGVHELNRELGLELPIGPRWSTLAGLAIALHGSLPAPGTRLIVDEHLEIEVLEATSRRVRRLKLHRRRNQEDEKTAAHEFPDEA
jgi:putative hemolysin